MKFRRRRSDDGTPSRADARGQSAVLGVALLLGFTVVVGSTVAFAGMAIVQNGQESTQLQHAENEMAVLASKIAEVGLGDSPMQQVSFSSDEGEYEVRDDAGTMTIEHVNWTDGETETIDEVSLGAVVYENGDTEVAYEGGGVWRKTGGSASMVSPPEFHYRDGTLTLPVMNVVGDTRGSGRTTAIVRPGDKTRAIYPNATATYGDGTPYVNPVENGTVRVTVESEYYEGWEQYFDERTTGDIAVDHDERRVSVDLITFGDKGETEIREDEAIELRGYPEEDPMDDFNLTIVGEGSSKLNNLDWELTIDGERFVSIHNQKGSNGGVEVTDENGTTWYTDAFDIEGDDPQTLNVNLSTYDRSVVNEADAAEEKPLGEVFNGRIADEGTEVDLIPEDSNGNQRVDHGRSELFIDYDGESRYITFLQVTENEVAVELS